MTLDTRKEISVFLYESKDFRFCVGDDKNNLSPFDCALKEHWEKAQRNGVLRYTLQIKDWKFLEGQFKFLVQLNPNRAWNRRTPEHISSMSQPFDVNRFNFTKLPQKEILFDIENGDGNNVLVVNISPIEWGHCLILTDRFQCLPQCITMHSVCKAIELLLLSNSPYLRIIFNSLCAHASVNHLHWHLYYLKHTMLLEYINIEHYIGPLFLLLNFPSKGFCLKASLFEDIENLVFWVYEVVHYLQEQQIAHNVYITRAKSTFECKKYNEIRVYIWARESYIGIKDVTSFIPAVCELFGHLSIRTEEAYQNVTEKEVHDILDNITATLFSSVKEQLKQLIHNKTIK